MKARFGFIALLAFLFAFFSSPPLVVGKAEKNKDFLVKSYDVGASGAVVSLATVDYAHDAIFSVDSAQAGLYQFTINSKNFSTPKTTTAFHSKRFLPSRAFYDRS